MALYVGGSTLLLHGNGPDGSTVFVDDVGKTVTAHGNARISTAQSLYNGSSMYFDGAGSYASIAPAEATEFNFGRSTFAIELAVRLLSMPTSDGWPSSWSSHMGLVCKGVPGSGSGYNFLIGQTKLIWNDNDSARAHGTHGMTPGVWYRLAISLHDGTIRTFVEGQLKGVSTGITTDYTYNQPLLIGTETAEGAWLHGHIAELRITPGLALIEDYTPASGPLELLHGAQIAIQPHSTGQFGPGSYNPVVGKPKTQSITTDLTDRWPYGQPGDPMAATSNPWEFKGRGVIVGSVAEKHLPANLPLHRLVRLHREIDGAVVRSTWSDAVTGAYAFTGVPPGYKYFATSFDHTSTYRAVIADGLVPTLL